MLIRWGSLLILTSVLTACIGETGARPGSPQDEATPSQFTSTGPQALADRAAERLQIRAGGIELIATLRDTAAARQLRAQLPARVQMRDHGGVEKTGRLETPLTVTDEPEGADPDVGDLGYYAPGQDLVLYYGDQSYFDGIVILGRLGGDLAALADMEGDLNVQLVHSTRTHQEEHDEVHAERRPDGRRT